MVETGRIDIHDSKNVFEYYINRLNSGEMSEHQKKLILRFVDEAQMGKNSTSKVGLRRLSANLSSFFRLNEYFKKDLDKLDEKDIEQFYKDIENDRLKQKSGRPYKKSSKDEFIRNLKRYLRWAWKDDPKKYQTHAGWLREYEEMPNIPAITFEQAQKLVSGMKFLRDQAITIFLFDSGCRIEEALNLRIRDIEKKKQPNGEEFYIINIHGTKTKEAERRISVPLAALILTKWLADHPAITDKDAFLFPITYDAFRKVLRTNSKALLGMVVTPHQLRHSSATYYCQKINNPYKFVYRYGWTINSDQARRYIDRAKLGEEAQEELDNVIKTSKVHEVEEEMERMKIAYEKKLIEMSKELKNIVEKVEQISEGKTS